MKANDGTKPNENKKWGLDCPDYGRTFDTLQELIDDVLSSGQDPNYVITYEGKPEGEKLINYIEV